MKFIVGVFAEIGQTYNEEKYIYEDTIHYRCDAWADEAGQEFHKKHGRAFVCHHEFEFDVGQGITREAVLESMIDGLRLKQRDIRATAQMECTEIEEKIQRLIAIPDMREVARHDLAPVKEEGGLAPSELNDDIPF